MGRKDPNWVGKLDRGPGGDGENGSGKEVDAEGDEENDSSEKINADDETAADNMKGNQGKLNQSIKGSGANNSPGPRYWAKFPYRNAVSKQTHDTGAIEFPVKEYISLSDLPKNHCASCSVQPGPIGSSGTVGYSLKVGAR
jgi:hypothetical protein